MTLFIVQLANTEKECHVEREGLSINLHCANFFGLGELNAKLRDEYGKFHCSDSSVIMLCHNCAVHRNNLFGSAIWGAGAGQNLVGSAAQ